MRVEAAVLPFKSFRSVPQPIGNFYFDFFFGGNYLSVLHYSI